jgi:hypothetical protein
MAVYCWVAPAGIVALTGETAMDTSVGGGFTVRVADPLIVPDVAWIAVLPGDTAVANPVLLIVATLTLEEDHVTDVVRSRVLLSLKVPIAVNCWVVPLTMVGVAGVTATDTSVGAGVTAKVALAVIDPYAACTAVLPVETPVASPLLLTVAIAGLAELQVAELLRSCVLPSL